MKEEISKAIVEGIEEALTDGKGIRKYTTLDMFRFAKMKMENPSVPHTTLIRIYNEKYPELSNNQKLENLSTALNIDFYKKLSGGQ